MSRFPKIDQPCPLGIDEQKRIDGYCGRCEKAVHALDAMSDAQRESLMSNNPGAICVSYRRAGARLGAAMAMAMVVVPAAAGTGDDPKLQSGAAASPLASVLHPAQPKCRDAADAAEPTAQESIAWETITVGGVSRPDEAEWIDDSSLPDLPTIVEAKPSGK